MSEHSTSANDSTPPRAVVESIVDALRGLRFGSIVVTVQDGVVVQIDRIDKRRLTAPCSSSPTSRRC
jgi:hypothetical protein